MSNDDKCLRRTVIWVGRAEPEIQDSLAAAGWDVIGVEAGSGAEAVLGRSQATVALIDLRGDQDADLRALESLLASNAHKRWLALVGARALADARLATLIRVACFDFITSPVAIERLVAALGHAWGMARLGGFDGGDCGVAASLDGMIGDSPPMRRLADCIHKFAPVEVPVLITGETGTGKEVAARALHRLSARRERPFVAINCGALPANLVQSELFGHERGAFTGANSRKIGRIESAAGGTVFLDEIGDLPLDAQTNLLRFLQEGTIERLGSCESIRLDVRVLAATHVDLERAVADGRFREDLYYRLNVLRLPMPPLRERGEDIRRLAEHFLEAFRREHRTRVRGFGPEALAAMQRFAWPGNVRELMNRVRRAAVVAEAPLITVADLELPTAIAQPVGAASLDTARASAERDAIVACLRESRFNVSECARRLNVSRVTVYRLCKKYSVALDAPR